MDDIWIEIFENIDQKWEVTVYYFELEGAKITT